MADKIDQLKIGDASYDIDLPPDATPTIQKLVISGGTDSIPLEIKSTPTSGESYIKIWNKDGAHVAYLGADTSSNLAVYVGSAWKTLLTSVPSHASTDTTYGAGDTSNYGHVKLVKGDLNGQGYADGKAAASSHSHSQYFNNNGSYNLNANTGDFGGTVTIGDGTAGWEFHTNGTVSSNWMNIAGDFGIVFSQDVLISGNDDYAESAACDLVVQNGNVYANYFYAGSDIRLKENIEDTTLDSNKLLDNLHIVDFNYKADQDKKLTIGLIAQEFEAILPEKYHDSFIQIKHKDENNYLNINETKLVYIALLALKDQKKKIDDLELRIKALETR